MIYTFIDKIPICFFFNPQMPQNIKYNSDSEHIEIFLGLHLTYT